MAGISAAVARRTFTTLVELKARNWQLGAVFRKDFGVRAPDVIRLQVLRRDRFPGQQSAPSQPCDRTGIHSLDLQNPQPGGRSFPVPMLITGAILRCAIRPT